MKLFRKIFLSIFFSFVATVSLISYAISVRQIADAEKSVVEENKIIGSFLTKEIEVNYFENKWPFESLKKLSERKEVLFWWIVRDDGTIHLADNSSFMETYVHDYFPEIANRLGKENISLNRSQNYGIFSTTLETGPKKWSFWFGFSLSRVAERRKEIISLITVTSVSVLVVLGVILYSSVKHFTKPIKELTTGAERIGKGDLSYRIRAASKDELGQLSHSFNKMTDDLQKTTVSKDYVDNIIGNMTEMLIVVDIEGKIRTVNKATLELLQYRGEEILGHSIEKIFKLEDIPQNWMEFERLIQEDKLNNFETHFTTKEERRIPILFSSSAIRGESGHPLFFVCTARDITERKRAEDEREKLVKDLQKALAEIKQLSGLLPICSGCKKIRDDKGYWNQIEEYISTHSEAIFSHGLCPVCLKKLYPDL